MSLLKHRNFWIVQFALWVGFGLLTRFTWLNVHPPSWSWIIIYMSLGLVFSSLLAFFLESLQHKARVAQLFITVLLSVALGLLWRVVFNVIEYHIIESANNQFQFWGYFHNGKAAVMQLLLWSGGYWLLIYHLTLEKQHLKQQQLAIEAKEANLKMLHYQIAPHFLFNVLSSLDTLMLKGDMPTARGMLQKLSDYLRHTLRNEPKATQSLDEEIAQCRRYLDIEQMRFNEKMQVEWLLPEEIPYCQLPNGVLLPLFENALKHGGMSSAELTQISLELLKIENRIQLQLRNTLGQEKTSSEGFGIGLANTKERLQRYFGDKVRFSTDSENNRFIVKIEITQ